MLGPTMQCSNATLRSPRLQLFFICFLDVIMIVSGFVSYKAESPVGMWPISSSLCIMQIAVLGTLVTHLYASRTRRQMCTPSRIGV